jgi:peptide-methionine (S)-S-oxide reductase
VGYAGGRSDRPTYDDLGDHREVVEVTFDPRRISYEQLLDVFWNGQPIDLPPDPNPRVHLAILTIGEAQRTAAERDRARLSRQGDIQVEILPEPTFWPAEPMHQKFYLQRARPDLVERLSRDFGGTGAFLASTAATRLNAWLTPLGGEDDLRQAAELLGVEADTLRGPSPQAPLP